MTARGPTERDVLEQVSRVDSGCVIRASYARDKLRKKGWIERAGHAGLQVCWRITRYGRMELDFYRKETAS